MVAWGNYELFITNGTAIVELPVSVDENIDQVEKKLNRLFVSLRSKYYLFVSDPVVDGIDAIESNKVTIRISAETIPGEGFSGARIIRKEAQKCLDKKVFACHNQSFQIIMKKKLIIIGGHFMTSKYGINDIVE